MSTAEPTPPVRGFEEVGWCVPGVGVRRGDGSQLPPSPVFGAGGEVEPTAGVAELVGALRCVGASAAMLRDAVCALSPGEVVELMEALGVAAATVETMTVEVTGEALERDLPRQEARALSPVEWVRTHHRGLRGVGAGAVVQAALLLRAPCHEELAEGIRSGAVPVATAAAAARESAKVIGALPAHQRTDQVRAVVARALVGAAASGSPGKVRAMALELIAAHAGPEELDRVSDRARSQRELSTPADLGHGIYEYRWRTDAATMAMLEAALSPLSRPRAVRVGSRTCARSVSAAPTP